MIQAPDWKGALQDSLVSLETLNALAHSRHVAGYAYGQQMESWILNGRWVFDSLGNSGNLRFDLPRDITFPKIKVENVMTRDEFIKVLQPFGLENSWYVSDGLFFLPPAGIACASCGLGWNITNAHESRPALVRDFEFIEDKDWVGKSWTEIPHSFPQDNKIALFTSTVPQVRCSDGVVRNPQFIGNRHIPYDYKLQPGDALAIAAYEFRHARNSCPF